MHIESIRVLLIEDDENDSEIITRCLLKAVTPYDVVWAQTVAECITAYAAGCIDVVLTDLSLPDSAGPETVGKIRAWDPDVPIVVLTGLDDRDAELQSLEAGAQCYLLKSAVSPHRLQRAIDDARQLQQHVVDIRRLLDTVESQAEKLQDKRELLERKNRRLSKLYKTAHRFVDNVSHEFRTPLTVIKDYVTLVSEGVVGDVNIEQQRMLEIAGVRVDDLNNMVDDMLDSSKLESGMLSVWRRNCRLAEIVEEVRPGLDKKASIRDIAFEVVVADELPEIYVDREKVGRVIINLVTNAMKFCGEPGKVRLEAKVDAQANDIVISVTDNGLGIDQEALSQIFRRFRQLRTNIKSSTKGFGLGLNIAKELVTLNFGEMYVESQVGKGSTFSFSVPLVNPLEIMRRYLARVERLGNGSSVVSLVGARIDSAVTKTDAEDIDAFFNYLLRRNDLLFHPHPQAWLFVLPSPYSELDKFVARAKSEMEKTNRNRPYGPLPTFEMNIEGSWRVTAQNDVVLEHFRNDVKTEAVHA